VSDDAVIGIDQGVDLGSVIVKTVPPSPPPPPPELKPQFRNSRYQKRSDKVVAKRFRVTLRTEEQFIPGQEFAPRPHKAKELVIYGKRRSDVLDLLEQVGISGRRIDVIRDAGCVYADGRIDFGTEEKWGVLVCDGGGKTGTTNPFSKG
jgi:hypothetical protein